MKGSEDMSCSQQARSPMFYLIMLPPSLYSYVSSSVAAGGQPHGISPKDNVVKECAEEAGIPEAIARSAIAAGAVSYECINTDGGLKRDVMFVYDVCLPDEFLPVPQDGEVEEFFLWPVEKVMQVVADGGAYKPNCALVILDFLFRNGHITPEQEGYLELLASLRQGECS